MSTTDAELPSRRARNPRGQGGRLRDEILAGAAEILEQTGNEASISLRSVALRIGVAPPSITRFFADRTEIIDAVVASELGTLRDLFHAAGTGHEDNPRARLMALARAFYEYGRGQPNRYRVVFQRTFLPEWDELGLTMVETEPLIAETFGLVVATITDCVSVHSSTSTDPFADAVALWFAIHGLISLPPAIPSFPWPDADDLLDVLVVRLTGLTPARPYSNR